VAVDGHRRVERHLQHPVRAGSGELLGRYQRPALRIAPYLEHHVEQAPDSRAQRGHGQRGEDRVVQRRVTIAGGQPQTTQVEVEKADSRLSSRRMLAREHHVQGLRPSARHRHLPRRDRAANQRQIQLAVTYGVETRGHRQVDQLRLGGPSAFAHAGQRAIEPRGDARGHADPQRSRRLPGHHPHASRGSQRFTCCGEHAFARPESVALGARSARTGGPRAHARAGQSADSPPAARSAAAEPRGRSAAPRRRSQSIAVPSAPPRRIYHMM
jgi:hypothetical protein